MTKDNRKKSDKPKKPRYIKKAECSEYVAELIAIGNLSQAEAKKIDEYDFVFYLLTEITNLSERFRANKAEHTKESFYWVSLLPTRIVYELEVEAGVIIKKNPKTEAANLVNLVVTSDGLMDFQLIDAITTLRGVSVERIRKCLICGKFFWAKKDNAKTCKQKCAKTLYEDKRVAKTATAKEAREKWKNQDFSKEVRSKNNGTL